MICQLPVPFRACEEHEEVDRTDEEVVQAITSEAFDDTAVEVLIAEIKALFAWLISHIFSINK